MAQFIGRETVLQELEGLAEDRIPEVLDFIRFLKSRQEEHPPFPGRRPTPSTDKFWPNWITSGPKRKPAMASTQATP